MSKALKITEFPDYYVSDTGDVYSRKTGRFIKLKKETNKKTGYSYIQLCKNGKVFMKTVHRLVAKTFIKNPQNKCDVNHKNGNKTDNRVENLEWCSRSENMKHSFKTLGQKPTWLNKKGKEHPNAKLVQQIKNGTVIAQFNGASEAERFTGIHGSLIRKCCYGERKSTGGYQWRYEQRGI